MEVLFVLSAALWACSAQYIPPNPCPELFRYLKQGGQIFGEMEFQNDLSGDYSLSVNMSVKAYLNDDENIKIDLATSSDEIQKGQPLKFNVYFPTQSAIPRPTEVRFNGRVYCSGPPEELTPVGITNMWSAFYFKFSGPLTPRNRPQDRPIFTYPGRGPFEPERTITNVSNPWLKFPDFSFSDTPWATPPPTVRTPPPTIHTRPPTIRTRPPTVRTPPPTVPTPPPTVRTPPPTVRTPPPTVQTPPPTVRTPPPTKPTTIATPPPTTATSTQAVLQEDECGVPFIQHLIVGGFEVEQGQFPWMVAIMYSRQSSYIYGCTGSLVSKKHVVSAGHCVFYFKSPLVPFSDLLLVMGQVNIENWARGSVTRGVENVIPHPDYKQSQGDGDIAVLIMDKAVHYEDGVRPICLWQDQNDLDLIVGQEGTIAGWGKDESARNFVTRAKKISVPVVSQAQCLRSNSGFNRLTSNRTFCGGRQDGTGPCPGDSGAGFVMFKNGRWFLRGVVSSSLDNGSGCNLDDYLIFTDAAKVTSWLKSAIQA